MHAARVIVAGAADGRVVALEEPLSFWGGFSAERGVVTDEHHPQTGTSLSGVMLVMTGGRGSSSASSVLAEAARLGTAPAAFLLQRSDEILVTGALVARELYDVTIPVVLLDDAAYALAAAAGHASLHEDGTLVLS